MDKSIVSPFLTHGVYMGFAYLLKQSIASQPQHSAMTHWLTNCRREKCL